MVGPRVRKCVDIIHFLLSQGLCRRILDHPDRPVGLDQTFSVKRVRVLHLNPEAFRQIQPVRLKLLEGWQHQVIDNILMPLCLIAGSRDKCKIADIKSAVQRIRNFNDRVLAHPVGDQVRAAVHQKRPSDFVLPVIVMRKPSQRSFDTAGDDGNIAKDTPDQVAVNHAGTIRPFSTYASRCVRILMSALFKDGVMIHHRVHVSG